MYIFYVSRGVSSIVGAPCNVVSLCNRAGWLGVGYVEHALARHSSSHGVGVGSVSAVWLQAGLNSRRRLSEIIVVVE